MIKKKIISLFLFSILLLVSIDQFAVKNSIAESDEEFYEKVKSAASLWASTQETFFSQQTHTPEETSEFELANYFLSDSVNYLMENNIMSFQISSINDSPLDGTPPSWVIGDIGKWGDGNASDEDFQKAVVWLIENGVLTPESIVGYAEDPDPGPISIYDEDYEIETKQTIETEQQDSAPVCGPGTYLKDGRCVLDDRCGPGTILKDGVCVVDTSKQEKQDNQVKVPSPAIQEQQTTDEGGGCLIATATFGTELAPQVQMLRELRDNTLLQTSSGSTFMTEFNQFYYSFSPTIADWERQSPVFKEIVKITITPLLTSLSILNHVDMGSEEEVLSYGIGVILLNIGMYFVAPAIIIQRLFHSIRK